MQNDLRYWDGVQDYNREILSLRNLSCESHIKEIINNQFVPGISADLGCGPGLWLDTLRYSRKIYAVDFSQKMLSRAKSIAPSNTIFIRQNLESLNLPEKLDFCLLFNSFMPRNYSDALYSLSRIFSSLSIGGKILIILPSLESSLFITSAQLFDATRQAKKEFEIERIKNTSSYNNMANYGYMKCKNGTCVKFWIREEVEYLFNLVGMVEIDEFYKIEYRDYKQFQGPHCYAYPWFWGWCLERKF